MKTLLIAILGIFLFIGCSEDNELTTTESVTISTSITMNENSPSAGTRLSDGANIYKVPISFSLFNTYNHLDGSKIKSIKIKKFSYSVIKYDLTPAETTGAVSYFKSIDQAVGIDLKDGYSSEFSEFASDLTLMEKDLVVSENLLLYMYQAIPNSISSFELRISFTMEAAVEIN